MGLPAARMWLGKILGSIVSTVKVPSLRGIPLLILQPLNEDLQPSGDPLVVADAIGVGRGEIVYWEGSRQAAVALKDGYPPVDAAVIGVVDSVGKVGGTRGRSAT